MQHSPVNLIQRSASLCSATDVQGTISTVIGPQPTCVAIFDISISSATSGTSFSQENPSRPYQLHNVLRKLITLAYTRPVIREELA